MTVFIFMHWRVLLVDKLIKSQLRSNEIETLNETIQYVAVERKIVQ